MSDNEEDKIKVKVSWSEELEGDPGMSIYEFLPRTQPGRKRKLTTQQLNYRIAGATPGIEIGGYTRWSNY
jgi:hypothetical protein